jgi:Holliday junction resolvase RusA-like endonuclease
MTLQFMTDLAPSTNNAYKNVVKHNRCYRALSSSGAKFKRRTIQRARKAAESAGWVYLKGQRLGLRLTLTFKNGSRSDISNRVKLVEDAIAEALGFDDNVIDLLVVERTAPGEDQCLVTIEVLP